MTVQANEATPPNVKPRRKAQATTLAEQLGSPDERVELRQGEERLYKLREIGCDESSNVRGLDLVELAKKGPYSPGSPEDDRLDAELGDLLDSIPSIGLLEPPLVVLAPDGTPMLQAGYRRVAALWVLYGAECDVRVREMVLDEADQKAANLAENAARKDIAVWRAAERCYELKHTYGWSSGRIAIRVGFSVAHTENLIRLKSKLAPQIWDMWAAGREFGVKVLLALLPLSHEEQVRKLLSPRENGSTANGRGSRDQPKVPAALADANAGGHQEAAASAEVGLQPALSWKIHLQHLLDEVRSTHPGPGWVGGAHWLAGAEAALRAGMGEPLRMPFTTQASPKASRQAVEGADSPAATSTPVPRPRSGKAKDLSIPAGPRRARAAAKKAKHKGTKASHLR
jgi:ParB-like chromosome segregation protein Spo0J